jgi:hypothetical protein
MGHIRSSLGPRYLSTQLSLYLQHQGTHSENSRLKISLKGGNSRLIPSLRLTLTALQIPKNLLNTTRNSAVTIPLPFIYQHNASA